MPSDQWDDDLQRLGGHFLQSSKWALFKSRQGWTSDRIQSSGPQPAAMTQVLYRNKGPVSAAYVPRGPAFDPSGSGLAELRARFEAVCRKRRAVFAIVEPDTALPYQRDAFTKGMSAGPKHVQPARTVKIPLLDDEPLLQQMHQKTRYSVRLAMRRGVVVEHYDHTDVDGLTLFHELLLDTSARNEFGIHDFSYYRDFMSVMQNDAGLFVAFVEGHPAAALISVCFGTEAIYMYGGSSTENRAHGSAFLLQFEAMRWARARGMKTYDLWGIPAIDPEAPMEDGTVAGSNGDDWRGLYRFKTRFGGEIVDYPPTLEREFSRVGTWIAKRYLGDRL